MDSGELCHVPTGRVTYLPLAEPSYLIYRNAAPPASRGIVRIKHKSIGRSAWCRSVAVGASRVSPFP